MGLVRADLIGEMSDEERASRQAWIDRTSSNDVWAKKIFKPVGILLTGHQANRPYLKACIDSHAQLGLWITVAYDNFVDPAWDNDEFNKYPWDKFMPPKDIMEKIDMFLMPHHQVWGGVLYPYFWLLKFGTAAMQNFEYIYCSNTDFVIEKPEGFWEVFNMLGDADILTCGHDEPGKYANTAGFFVKSKALMAIVQHMQDHFIPWDVYEKYTNEIGNAEGRFGKAIADLGLKQVIVEPPGDDMLRTYGKGLWWEKMGFRHIHSEHNYAYRNKGIPPHYKYLDPRFMGDEYNKIKEYWDTQDLTVLEDWWARE